MFRQSLFHRVLSDSLPKLSSALVGLVAEYEKKSESNILEVKIDERARKEGVQFLLARLKASACDISAKYDIAVTAAQEGWTEILSFLIFAKLVNPNKYPYPLRSTSRSTLLLEACRSQHSTPETRALLIKVSRSHTIDRVHSTSSSRYGSGGPDIMGGCAIEHVLQKKDFQSARLLFQRKANFFSLHSADSNRRYLPMDYETLSFVFSQSLSWFQKQEILHPRHIEQAARQKYITDCHARSVKEKELTKILANKIKPQLKELHGKEPLVGEGYRKRFAEILKATARCFSPELLSKLIESQIAVFANTPIDVKLLIDIGIVDKYWIDPTKVTNRANAASYIERLSAILDTIAKEFSVNAPIVLAATPKPEDCYRP